MLSSVTSTPLGPGPFVTPGAPVGPAGAMTLHSDVRKEIANGGPERLAQWRHDQKGPPGTPDNFNDTAAPAHANSACAYSGLNDLNPAFGQTVSIVQTAAAGSG